MTIDNQIKILRNKILEKVEILYNSNEENVYDNFNTLRTMDLDYKLLTKESLIISNNYLNEFQKKHYDLLNVIEEEYIKLDQYLNDQINLNEKVFKTSKIITDSFLTLAYFFEKNKEYINKITYHNKSIKISDKEQCDLITFFLKETNKKYKYLYKEMLDKGKIFIIKEENDKYTTGHTFVNIDYYNRDDYYILIKDNPNDLAKLSTLSHELGHIIENLETKKNNISPIDFRNYFTKSLYTETYSELYNLKFFDFLENIGFKREDIIPLRVNWLINGVCNHLANVINEDKDLYSIKYVYGGLISAYINNIEDKDEIARILKKFNKEKLTNQDIEIFNNICCNEYVMKKSLKKCLSKLK